MFNSEIPSSAQLPSTAQLIRSTVLAFVIAMALLVTVVMPAEYGIDPTGAGRVLGLTQMGEIKEQLAHEAEADRQKEAQAAQTAVVSAEPAPQPTIKPQPQQTTAPVKAAAAVASTEVKPSQQSAAEPMVKAAVLTPEVIAKNDSISFVLRPGQGAEVKLEMKQDAVVDFSWSANGGKLNYDTHGDPYNPPKGYYHGYGKGRFKPGQSGQLKAAFDGNHGWFWRNRSKQDVTLSLDVKGDYLVLKRVI